MELDISHFWNTAAPRDYSASIAEIGRDAGAVTWSHAVEDAPDYPLLDTEEKRDAFRDHVRGYGAWSDEEIAAWSDDELTALLLQMIAGDIRDHAGSVDGWCWAEYRQASEDGRVSGRLFRADDGRILYEIGN